MPAGQALCQVCPDVDMTEEDGGLEVGCNNQVLDGTFWAAATGGVAGVTSCCEAVLEQRDVFDMTGLANPKQARNAWLYDNFLTCTGIRTVYPVP